MPLFHGRVFGSGMGVCLKQAETQQIGPDDETSGFSDEDHQTGQECRGFVESKAEQNDIAHQWEPAQEGGPDSVFIHYILLLDEFLVADFEIFLYPLKLAGPTDEICHESAERVAGRGDQKAGHGVLCHRQEGDIKGI